MSSQDTEPRLQNVAEFTVSELSFAVKHTVEEGFSHVRVRGEISGYRGPHSSGHAYFALKDDAAKIDAVVWRGAFAKLRFRPEEGMEVIATGRLTTYPNSSKYQIVIEALEPAGVGALMALLEERKKKFAAEGLFDQERKRQIPFLPKVIGVVTSPTGAVIRDILHRLADRFPSRVIVWPVRVQGETSAAEVAAAIDGFDALAPSGPIPRPDVLIVARGGGSLEDLWSFNEEIVIRAVARCSIPLISAIGHETDWTLLDHVADLRAPTPTGAAEMAVPVRADLLTRVEMGGVRLSAALRRGMEERRQALRSVLRALPAAADFLGSRRQRLDLASSRLGEALGRATRLHATRFARLTGRLTPATLMRGLSVARERLARLGERQDRAITVMADRRRQRLSSAEKLLGTLSYQSVLSRGFALVRDAEGRPVRRRSDVVEGAALDIEFQDGRLPAVAGSGAPGSLLPSSPTPEHAAPKRAPAARKPRPPEGQGTLF
ncbi:MAG: exodeoxyribonuclease VII large subunit [Ancalomicrobiaceae bacterium]|nr:exodeoxyribonuclease VII large subunit [Ancalomicrobiaceae bacterium]